MKSRDNESLQHEKNMLDAKFLNTASKFALRSAALGGAFGLFEAYVSRKIPRATTPAPVLTTVCKRASLFGAIGAAIAVTAGWQIGFFSHRKALVQEMNSREQADKKQRPTK